MQPGCATKLVQRGGDTGVRLRARLLLSLYCEGALLTLRVQQQRRLQL